MRPLSLSLALLMLLALPGLSVADEPANAKLDELWKTGSLWQVGDNIPKVEAARKEIVAAGDAGLAFIFTKLSSTDGLEYRCLEAVFKGFGAKALPGLYERMAHEDVKVRRNVSAMLGVIDDKSAAAKMVEHLKKESDLRCKVGHLQTLARWKEPTALDPLIECTRVTQEQEQLAERLKVRIVPLLGNYDDYPSALERLEELADDPAYFVRDAALGALYASRAGQVHILRGFDPDSFKQSWQHDPAGLRRRIPCLLELYKKGDYRKFFTCMDFLLGSPKPEVRGDAATFISTKGYEIAVASMKDGFNESKWSAVNELRRALGNETDPYALACIENALKKFGFATEK
ncbi:hypothetical protein PLCT2_01509 [Planctomycetaceae bacterium]|nr:hypothetical protein PLCT2_01509 [Planctomycetaceae bacterium]